VTAWVRSPAFHGVTDDGVHDVPMLFGRTGLLGGAWSPIGWVVGFIEAPHAAVLAEDQEWRSGLGQELEISTSTPFPECLELLEPLEAPWTTELLVDCGPWTAYLNNQKNGGDPTSAASQLAARLGTRCAIAMHAPRYGPGHGGTRLWMSGPDGEPPLMYTRTLCAVAEDGRWSWHESGRPLPFEDVQRYQARRISARFDRGLLVAYLAHLGIRVDDPTWFGTGTRLRQRVTWSTNPETRGQAAHRLGIASS
jgi:hypothetical protein